MHQFTVIFQNKNGLPTDVYVNTFHFKHQNIAEDFDNVRDRLKDFYTAVPSGSSASLADQMPNILKSEVLVKAINLSDPKPRVPVYESSFDHTFTGTTCLPTEVALCLSYQAKRESGTAQGRRRNRDYLGPFIAAANQGGRPDPGVMQIVAGSAQELLDKNSGLGAWDWMIWSTTGATGYEIDNGWVDNAWDTQRRRGFNPSARIEWPS